MERLFRSAVLIALYLNGMSAFCFEADDITDVRMMYSPSLRPQVLIDIHRVRDSERGSRIELISRIGDPDYSKSAHVRKLIGQSELLTISNFVQNAEKRELFKKPNMNIQIDGSGVSLEVAINNYAVVFRGGDIFGPHPEPADLELREIIRHLLELGEVGVNGKGY